MKCVDAHLHFNLAKKNPAEDIVQELKGSDCSAGVLILNTVDDKNFFLEHSRELFDSGIGWHIGVLVGLSSCQADVRLWEFLRSDKIPYSIKLHPRLSRLALDDIPCVLSRIPTMATGFQNIIIDGFYYGAHLENRISLELAIAASRMFPTRNIVYSHSGGIRVLETLLHMRELSNVVYDFSLSCNYLCKTSVRQDFVQMLRFNKSRVMFGSDYPDFAVKNASEATRDLACDADLSPAESMDLFYNNALKYYRFTLI